MRFQENPQPVNPATAPTTSKPPTATTTAVASTPPDPAPAATASAPSAAAAPAAAPAAQGGNPFALERDHKSMLGRPVVANYESSEKQWGASNAIGKEKFNNPFGERIPFGNQHYYEDPNGRELTFNRKNVGGKPEATVYGPTPKPTATTVSPTETVAPSTSAATAPATAAPAADPAATAPSTTQVF